jgi:hypothetical protein
MSWYQLKLFLEHSSGVTMDSIHVIVGVVIQLIVARLSGRTVANWLPWLCVLVLELLNEASDLWIEQWPQPGMQYGESAKDLLITMFLPTLLLLTARYCPRVFGATKRDPRLPRPGAEKLPDLD